MAGVPRRRLLPWLAAVVSGLPGLPPAVAGDVVGSLVQTLRGARNFKVRAHAATLLARLSDPRVLPALMQAAGGDPHPAVRGAAVRLLGRVAHGQRAAAQQARPVIARAMSDRDPSVRRQATAALAEVERSFAPEARPAVRANGRTVVAVGTIGDRTGHAPRAIRDRMRALMAALLEREPRVELAGMSAPGVAFLVDGAIARLQIGPHGRDLEAVCAVELVVSRPPRGIVTVASGEAIVQHPHAQLHSPLADRMQDEALDNAVRSAHESLAQFLRAQ